MSEVAEVESHTEAEQPPEASSAPAAPEHAAAANDADARTPERAARENAIPHSRVREMMERSERKIRAEYDERIREYEERLRKYDRTASPLPQPPGASGMWFPAVPDHREEIGKLRNEVSALRVGTRLEVSWTAFEAANRGLMMVPGARATLRAAFVEAWKGGRDPERDVQPLVRDYSRFLADKAALSAKRREQAKSPERRVMPSGRGGWAPSGSPPPQGSKPGVAEKIRARLATRED